MKKLLPILITHAILSSTAFAQGFSSGNLVVLQTTGTTSKSSSTITLKEFSTSGTAGISVSLPSLGTNPIQTAGAYGGSEGFLTTSTDGKYLLIAGYGTSASFTDITSTSATTVPRIVGTIAPSGFYLQVASSSTFYSANDIRGAVSDGTNYWASGAAAASIDGINYFGPSTAAALGTGATPPKAYGLRIFNGQLYYSTQKSGPTNTSSQLGIFSVGTGLPTSGTVTVSQVINTGTIIPQDFSFNATGDVCYIAISLNSSSGGIQKWTKTSGVWSLAYTLGTGVTNVGVYGLVVDYSATSPIIYATTFESTGNRIVKIIDNGTLGSASISTIVPATSNIFLKGISFAPIASGTPIVNLTINTDTASEAGKSIITITANSSAILTSAQTVNIAISGLGITSGDYSLSASTITIPATTSSASVTFTIKDDILGEGTEVAKITMKSPSSGIILGIDTVKNITITDNDGNNIPIIKINTDSTSNYIDWGVKTSPTSPFILSGVMNNPTDPAATLGINFLVADLETVSTALTMTIKSSDTNVVPLSAITVSGADSIRNVKITPKKVGYCDITLTVSDGIDSSKYTLKYAVSKDSFLASKSYWHTGMSDASAAMVLDGDYYVAADDELNYLNVYSRKNSGLPLSTFEYTVGLSLPDAAKPEVDLEAVAPSLKIANRVYWMGSMSNSKAPFDSRPNRDRIFATTIAGSGTATTISFVGYTALRTHIINWGDANGYNFTASAAAGVDSKLPNGFAAEGMVMGPDSTTLYIGLRAPLVPVTARNKALIVPIKNFETWFNNGTPIGAPNFAAPIELNLGGRSIRELIKLSNGTYVIIAGNCGGSPLTGAIYKWTGNAYDSAILVSNPNTTKLNIEGAMQVGSIGSNSTLQVITDNGDDEFYNDGIVAKDFNSLPLRKFKSVLLDSLDFTMSTTNINPVSASNNLSEMIVYPNPTSGLFTLLFNSIGSQDYTLNISDIQGKKVYELKGIAVQGGNKIFLNIPEIMKGLYLIQLTTNSSTHLQKLMIQ